MLKVASERLTEREREYLRHFESSRERGVSFAEYCRAQGRRLTRVKGRFTKLGVHSGSTQDLRALRGELLPPPLSPPVIRLCLYEGLHAEALFVFSEL